MYQVGYCDALIKLGFLEKDSLDLNTIRNFISKVLRKTPSGRFTMSPALDKTIMLSPTAKTLLKPRREMWRSMTDPLPAFTPKGSKVLFPPIPQEFKNIPAAASSAFRAAFPQTPKPIMMGGKLFWPPPINVR